MESTHFTRDEVMSGFTARRAQMTLYVIESRVGQWIAQSRRAADPFDTEREAGERDLAFIEAFSLGRQPPVRPAVQDLERFADRWAALAPASARSRAALARALAAKYPLVHSKVPRIRAALALDAPETRAAYQQLCGQPLESIFAPAPSIADRVKWAWAATVSRIDNLPPFWTAFAMTLTETIGVGILALPIAVAGVGPLAGIALAILFGMVNLVTIAQMAESNVRSGVVRQGHAYIGRVVGDFLGPAGSYVLSAACIALAFLNLMAYYIGFSTTLAAASGVSPAAWVLALFALSMWVASRGSLNATVASALMIGAINILLLLSIAALSVAHIRLENLTGGAFPPASGAFEVSALGSVFGVIFCTFFGHMSASTCAKAALKRDPGGKALMRGTAAGLAVAIALSLMWIVTVNGAVPAAVLAAEHGTSLAPLAREAGLAVLVLGTLFTTLSLGMGSLHGAVQLAELTRERLPAGAAPTMCLPRRGGQAILKESPRWLRRRTGLRISLTYAGLGQDGPQFRLDVQLGARARRLMFTARERWAIEDVRSRLEGLPNTAGLLAIDVLRAEPAAAWVRIHSTLDAAFDGRLDREGLSMAGLLDLGQDAQRVVAWLLKNQGAGADDLAACLGSDIEDTRALLSALVEFGAIVEIAGDGNPRYRALIGRKRGRPVSDDIWQALDGTADGQPGRAAAPAAGSPTQAAPHRLSRPVRTALSLLPTCLAFALAEALLLSGSNSFARLVDLAGVIVVPMLSGVFPVLLLKSSRLKGEHVPAGVSRILGHPLVLGGIYAVSVSIVFAHGLLVWDEPFPRAIALLCAGLMVATTVIVSRRGAFTPRTVVAARASPRGVLSYAVTSAGLPHPAAVSADYPGRAARSRGASGELADAATLRAVSFELADLPARGPQEMKIIAQHISDEDEVSALPGRIQIQSDGTARVFCAELADGQLLIPHDGRPAEVRIALADSAGDRAEESG
jgi:amino acid permease